MRQGPPKELILQLKSWLRAETFIESGTFQGTTAQWAAGEFQTVITIEGSVELAQIARQRFADAGAKIELLIGDSRTVLTEALARVSKPAILWLDAHWSCGETFGQGAECPLLQELAALSRSTVDHVILVDDAQCFLAPPPPPHQPADWPDLVSTIAALADEGRRYVVVFEDVFVAVPTALRPSLQGWMREHAPAPPPTKRASWLRFLPR